MKRVILPLVSLLVLGTGYGLYCHFSAGSIPGIDFHSISKSAFMETMQPLTDFASSIAAASKSPQSHGGESYEDLSLKDIDQLIEDEDLYHKLNASEMSESERVRLGNILEARSKILEMKIRSDLESLESELADTSSKPKGIDHE